MGQKYQIKEALSSAMGIKKISAIAVSNYTTVKKDGTFFIAPNFK
jgi:hypothetical protein